jgi:hypothetical protein
MKQDSEFHRGGAEDAEVGTILQITLFPVSILRLRGEYSSQILWLRLCRARSLRLTLSS